MDWTWKIWNYSNDEMTNFQTRRTRFRNRNDNEFIKMVLRIYSFSFASRNSIIRWKEDMAQSAEELVREIDLFH